MPGMAQHLDGGESGSSSETLSHPKAVLGPCLEGAFSGLGPAHRSLLPSHTPCSLAQVRPDGQPQEVEFIPRDPKTQTV